MRKGWEIKYLPNVSTISTGKWDANHATENGLYKFFTCAYEHTMCDTKRFSGECLILPGNGVNVGEVFFHEGDFDAYQRTYVISDIKILPKFLFYHMLCFWKVRNRNKQYGSATNFLKIGNFNDYEISVPTAYEQQSIISILDEAFAAIEQAKENLQRNLQNAKELFQSELNRIFSSKGKGWTEKNLEEIALVFGRGKSKHRPRNDKKLYGGNYPFIQTGDVRNSDKFITQYSQTYNEVGLAQSKLWQKGTICITIAANIAETGILTFDSCFPDSMIGLVVDPKKADVNFAYYALQFLKSALQLLGKGSAQDNINMGTFEAQKFPFPSLEMQKEIVQRLNNLSAETKNLENTYQQKLDNIEELKKSILQKVFSGELNIKRTAVA